MSTTRFDRVLSMIQGDQDYNLRTKAGRRAKAQDEVSLMNLDAVVSLHSAFGSFSELIETRLTSGYRPTLRVNVGTRSTVDDYRRCFMALKIADAYDAAMTALGDNRRAWRGV
jgi:hypothetical protein